MPDRDDDLVPELADQGDDRVGLEELDDDVDLLDDEDDDDDLDDEDEFEELDDATEDDLDYAVALFREDGQPMAMELPFEVANDLEELIAELRRMPGDGGALGMVSIAGEFLVIVRVAGSRVQCFLSDIFAAADWPLAGDVAEFLDEEVDEDDDEGGPVGDADMLADLGLDDFALEQMCLDDEESSDDLGLQIAEALRLGEVMRKVVD